LSSGAISIRVVPILGELPVEMKGKPSMRLSFFTKISLMYLLRSIARMVSTVILILLVMVIKAEGLPNLHEFSRGEIISSAMFIVMIAGLILAWWRELAGAVLILGGFFAFTTSEYVVSGDAGMSWIFMLFPIAGVLFLIYWWLTRKQ
jgi:hypothetical protein